MKTDLDRLTEAELIDLNRRIVDWNVAPALLSRVIDSGPRQVESPGLPAEPSR